jgi:hypothetical protein
LATVAFLYGPDRITIALVSCCWLPGTFASQA